MSSSKVVTEPSSPVTGDSSRIVALIGANGMLARMVRECTPENYSLHLFDLPEFDLTDRGQVVAVLGELSPDVIINCAAYTNVDGAETNQEIAMAVNGSAVGFLAEAALEVDATLVHVSTDYVFDGSKIGWYQESDEICPQSVYGQSKALGEQEVTGSGLRKYFIVRTSWLYGPYGNNFVETILRLSAQREGLRIISDQVGSPTYTGDLAKAIFHLLTTCANCRSTTDVPYGIYHFANEGSCSWHEFACAIVEEGRSSGALLRVNNIDPICTEEYPLPARRPANSVFDKSKYKETTGARIPEWRESLQTYFSQREVLL